MKLLQNAVSLEGAVVAFCAWQAVDLLAAWRHSPLDRFGGLSFLVWFAPVIVTCVRSTAVGARLSPLTVFAFATSLAGLFLDLNVARCVALAMAIGALLPAGRRRDFWLAGAGAWMPVYGWFASTLSIDALAVSRLLLAIVASAAWMPWKYPTLRPT